MFSIPANFIVTFKCGDNIVFNLQILGFLYKKYDESDVNEKSLILKPIIILLTTIIEAILYDFNSRIRICTIEGVRGLSNDIVQKIRMVENRDEFYKLVSKFEKHELFKELGSSFISDCKLLVKIRNRIHIQNKHHELEPDDFFAFSQERKELAEKTLERLVKLLNVKHPRDESRHHVSDFIFPWREHFPAN